MQDHAHRITHSASHQDNCSQTLFQQNRRYIGRNGGNQKQQGITPCVVGTGNLGIHDMNDHNGNGTVNEHLTGIDQQIQEVEQPGISSGQENNRQQQDAAHGANAGHFDLMAQKMMNTCCQQTSASSNDRQLGCFLVRVAQIQQYQM